MHSEVTLLVCTRPCPLFESAVDRPSASLYLLGASMALPAVPAIPPMNLYGGGVGRLAPNGVASQCLLCAGADPLDACLCCSRLLRTYGSVVIYLRVAIYEAAMAAEIQALLLMKTTPSRSIVAGP